MLTVDNLKSLGVNVEEGLGRCLNNETIYLKLVGLGLSDAHFEELRHALDAGDTKTAFEAAHALKGVIANLSLTPILTPLSEMTEALRGQTGPVDVEELYGQMKEALDAARALL